MTVPAMRETTAALILTLNALVKECGLMTHYTQGGGGWVHEHIDEYVFSHRPSTLPDKIAKRRRQLERLRGNAK
jgi:hypothetical protein